MDEANRLVISEKTQRKINKIKRAYEKKNMTQEEKAQAVRLVDEVLEELFKTPYSFMIPMSFINTELGMMLMSVKCGYEYYYTIYDIQILCNRTRSTIYYSNNIGKFNLINRGTYYVATENEVRRLLAAYGLNENDIEKRIKAFWKVKSVHHDKKILKKDFVEEFQKILKDMK